MGTPGCRIQGYDVVESGCGLTARVRGQLESVWASNTRSVAYGV